MIYLANNSCCLQKQMKFELQVERFYGRRLEGQWQQCVRIFVSTSYFIITIQQNFRNVSSRNFQIILNSYANDKLIDVKWWRIDHKWRKIMEQWRMENNGNRWTWTVRRFHSRSKVVGKRSAHRDIFSRNLIKSTRNQVVFTMHRLIWNRNGPVRLCSKSIG